VKAVSEKLRNKQARPLISKKMSSSAYLADLCERLSAGSVVPVIGAGVSRQTAAMPTWRGAIESAISHAVMVGCASEQEEADVQKLLDDGQLVSAAQQVKSLLGAPTGEYPFWLKATFRPNPTSELNGRLVNTIADLLCPLVATTNYDKILTELMPEHPEPVSWQNPVGMVEGLREGNRVLHLHGIFTDPSSVIFGVDNYEELVVNDAYQAVLRVLWLERTLLFIGCSFGGLRDPDFTKLLDWATTTFSGSTTKHYALIHRDEATAELVREYLLRWRIQVIPYGPTHADLATAVNDLNPNRERAIARRVRLIQNQLDAGTQEVRQEVINLLEGLTAPGRQHLADMTLVADTLLQTQHQAADQLRDDLIGLQQLTLSMIDPASLRYEIGRWREVHSYTGSFREVVTAASAAIELFPSTLLHALKRRGVHIHGNLLSGYCKQALSDLERWAGSMPQNEYYIENATRVLTSLQGVLEADPNKLFPRPASGVRLSTEREATYLLVARYDRLELRRGAAPSDVVAKLPLNTATVLYGLDFVNFDGASAVCAYDQEHVFIWDPRRASAPIARFEVSEAYGINGVAHVPDSSPLHSIATTTSGTVYELYDLSPTNSWTPGREQFLTQPVLLNGQDLYTFEASRLPLLRLDILGTSAPPQPVLTAASLRDILRTLPGVPTQIEQRLTADRKYLGAGKDTQERTKWEALRFNAPELSSAVINGERLLALNINILFFTATASLLFFFKPEEDTVVVRGYFYLDDATISKFSFSSGRDARPRLVYALLSDFKETYDLVGWARASQTTNGLIFMKEGSTLRTYDDMLNVILIDSEQGFASDDSGGLFKFSISDRSYYEIERDENSRIRKLSVITW
jgi:hypothetical protein